MSGLAGLMLLWPGGPFDGLWAINPRAEPSLTSLGPAGIVLMGTVSAGCAAAATGLWARRRYGWYLALLILTINLAGDTLNAVLGRDPGTLIGLPVGGVLIAYLLSARVRRVFGFPAGGAVAAGETPAGR